MKKNSSRFIFLILVIFCFLNLCSCGKKVTQLHLHDRHVLSYDYVKNYAAEKGPLTLVLLDYHHDISSQTDALNSVNWVGKLIEEDSVKQVIWLSGKKLELPNRNSRMAWLERSIKDMYPETAEKMRQAIKLVDWYDLQELKLRGSHGVSDVNGPFVITLDFDVFTKDPGEVPEEFVDELCYWIQKQKPELVTLALSATYQPEPSRAWEWLKRFIQDYKSSATWILESGDFGEKEESKDDFAAHRKWEESPEVFKNCKAPFYAGAYLWQNTPADIVEALVKKNVKAGNKAAEEIIQIWNDEKLKKMKKTFDSEQLVKLAGFAETAMQSFFDGKKFQVPEQNKLTDKENFGVAVRFRNKTEDRGCLSLYTGIVEKDIPAAVEYCTMEALVDPRYLRIQPEETEEMFTNISIFSNWEIMSSYDDFEPGVHSLLLEDTDGEMTLLQSSIALERNYTREEFLARLSNKAGLGLDGWKKNALHFYRAQTITYTEY